MRQALVLSRFWMTALLALVGVQHSKGLVDGQAGEVAFDFRQPGSDQGWKATHDVELSGSNEGLRVAITGSDPYFTGPILKTPPVGRLIVRISLRSDTGGGGQLFYDVDGPREEHSVRFSVPAGVMTEVFLPLPEVGPEIRFRLDPPGTAGECMIESIRVVSGLDTTWPAWEPIPRPTGEDVAVLSSGTLELRFSKTKYGVFEIIVDGRPMGTSGVLPQVAVEHAGQVVWLGLENDQFEQLGEHRLRMTASAKLPGGGVLELEQQFIRTLEGQIEGEAALSTSTVCQLVYAPLLLLFPGDGTFGDQKGQAIFPGVEYLDNEPSSSDADVDAARSVRRVPAAHKITFPLMAVQAEGRYLGLIWEPQADVAALFDSPDRRFGTKSHVLGLIAPGATDGRREDGQELPSLASTVQPDHPIRVTARLFAERGDSVIPAVQKSVEWKGLPELPPQPTLNQFARRLSVGWHNTSLRDGTKFRHAIARDAFPGQPAADAIWMMRQLADIMQFEGLSSSPFWAVQLRRTAEESLAALPPGQLHHATVGHIRSPNATLLLGDPLEGMQQAREVAQGQLNRLGPEGKLEYVRDPNRPDFARTHWSKEASGLAAPVVARALAEAAFSGDQTLIDQAIAQLRKLDKYTNTVPRGAQTWEIPLHTPDILASAHLVKAYTLGYELTRDPKFLEQAKYWAWTGVPFVYLQPQFPVAEHQVGPYATIAVLGATHWDSVLWIGLPVQWCGLVYADALQHLNRYDESGPWNKIAAGIVLSGIQQTYPNGPHEGLLPDSFNLLGQSRNPADINPGTLQVPAMRLLGGRVCYDVRKIVESGWTIHAPAEIVLGEASKTRVAFSLQTRASDPYSILVHGLKAQPKVEVRRPGQGDLAIQACALDERFDLATGTLILKLAGRCEVTLDTSEPAKAP